MSSNPETTESGEQPTNGATPAPENEASTQNETTTDTSSATAAADSATTVEAAADASAETPADTGSEATPAAAPAPAPAPEPAVTEPAPAEAEPAAPEAPAAEPVSATADTDAAVLAGRKLTIAEEMLKSALSGYVETMRPAKPIKADVGAQVQAGLYRTLMHLLSKPGNEFTPLWTLLLDFIHQDTTGVFGERFLYRFFPQLRMPPNDIRNFERILHLATTTADPTTRGLAVKQIDLGIVLQGMSQPTIVQNIRSYYSA